MRHLIHRALGVPLPFSNELNALKDVLVASKALPVLFVGSGVSRRYIGSPDWDGLLEHFAGLTRRPISFYRGRADGDKPYVASLIATEFYAEWFDQDRYADSRASFEAEVDQEADPLKFEIAQMISGLPLLEAEEVASELESLSRAHVHAVVTTNYDTIIEDVRPDLEVFVGQQDVLFATTQTIGEIYKIHGSVTDPKSMILTREDYEAYWARNPYLIAKLLTILVEHPVLFLGYGLGDGHINRMLGNLIECLTPEQIDVLNDRLIFVRRAAPGEGGLARSTMTVGAHTLSIRELACEDFKALYEMLADLPQQFPVKLLRQLRENIYELTFSTEPSGRVHVLPMDPESDVNDVEVVVGVGMMERLGEKGYRALGRADLMRDMLAGVADHQADLLVEDLLPRIFRQAKFAPVYYPLKLADRLADDGSVRDPTGLPANARSLISGGTALSPYGVRDRALRTSQSFRELLAEDEQVALDYGLLCTYDEEDVVALQEFLQRRIGDADTVGTSEAKLACKFDALVYGANYKGDKAALLAALNLGTTRRGARRS